MTKKSLSFLIMIGVSCILMSCASSNFIPEGSQSLGTYEGNSDEVPKNIGKVLVRIYQLKGTTLEGKFDSGRGNISGQLSSDNSQITGTYYLTKSKSTGTWQAKRK
jgi:hypothetical protein